MAEAEDTNNTQSQSRPGTPPAPPFSPVTPVMSHTTLFPPPPATDSLLGPSSSSTFVEPSAPQTMPPSSQNPHFAPEPDPVPISESENPDAIALRSALSILQMQRQQALRDIRKLDELKHTAVRDPETFSRELTSGRLKSTGGDIMHPHSKSDDDEGEAADQDGEGEDVGEEDTMEVDGASARQAGKSGPGKFGKIPTPQNVIRMPPVNWAKYHIVGEPLDELHEEQRRRPSPGEPRRDTATHIQPTRLPEHHIAAPYRPFVDHLEPSATTKGGNKRRHGQT